MNYNSDLVSSRLALVCCFDVRACVWVRAFVRKADGYVTVSLSGEFSISTMKLQMRIPLELRRIRKNKLQVHDQHLRILHNR